MRIGCERAGEESEEVVSEQERTDQEGGQRLRKEKKCRVGMNRQKEKGGRGKDRGEKSVE